MNGASLELIEWELLTRGMCLNGSQAERIQEDHDKLEQPEVV